MIKRTLAQGTVRTFSGMAYQQLMGYVNTILALRFIDVTLYGTVIFLVSIIKIASTFSKQGMHIAATKFISEYVGQGKTEDARRIFNDSRWLIVIGAIPITLLSPLIYQLMPASISTRVEFGQFLLIFIPFIFLTALLSLNQYGLMGLKLTGLSSLTGFLLQPSFRIICTVSILSFLPTITGLIFVQIIPLILAYLVSEAVVARNRFAISFPSFSHAGTLYRFSLPLIGSEFLALTIYETDKIFLGYMTSPESVGIYNVSSRIAFFVIAPFWASAHTFGPYMSEYWSKGQYDKLKGYYQKLTYTFMFLLGSLFSIILINNQFILGLFGQEFTTENSLWIIVIVGAGLLFQMVPGQNGQLYNMTGKTYLAFIDTFLTAILNVTLNYFLIRRYGLIGAALATGISIAFVNLIGLGYFSIVFKNKVHPFCSRYFINLIYMISISSLGFFMRHQNPVYSNWVLFTVIITFGGTMYFRSIKRFFKEKLD